MTKQLTIDEGKVSRILHLCEVFEGDKKWGTLYKSLGNFIAKDLKTIDPNLYAHYSKGNFRPQSYTLERAFARKDPYYVASINNPYLEDLLDRYLEKLEVEFERNKRMKKSKPRSMSSEGKMSALESSMPAAIKEVLGNNDSLSAIYTSIYASALFTGHNDGHHVITAPETVSFFSLIKSLYTAYTSEALFNSLSIVADIDSTIGKIPMKDYFIQLSYVTKTEIKTRESLVRNETELNALKIRRSIENNQQLTKDYIVNFSLQNIQKLLVLGNPGVGKSTFCRWLCHQWSQMPETTNNVIPVYIQLRALEFDPRENAIVNYISRNYVVQHNTSENVNLRHVLQKVHPFVCFVLDGFDELAEDQKEKLLVQLNEISSNYKCILASRPYGVLKTFDFKPDQFIQLDGFDTSNVNNYIDVFLQKSAIAKGKVQEKLIEIIQMNPTLTDFAHNPLMLSFIVYIYLSDDNAEEILGKIQTRFDLQQIVISWMFVHNKSKVSAKLDNRLISTVSKIANEMEFGKTAERTVSLYDRDYESVLLPVSQLGIGQLTENNIGKYKFYFNSITFQEYFASLSIAGSITSAALEYLLQDSYFWNLAAMVIGQISNESASGIIDNLLTACEKELQREDREYIYYKYLLLLSECRAEYLNSKVDNSVLHTINRAFAQNIQNARITKNEHLKYAFAECTQRIYIKLNDANKKLFKGMLLNEMKTSWQNPNDTLLKWDASCKHLPILVKYLDLNLDIAFTTSCLDLLITALEEYKDGKCDFSALWDLPDFVVSILQNNPAHFFLITRAYLEKVLPLLPMSFLNFKGRIQLHYIDANTALKGLTEIIRSFNDIDDTATGDQLTGEIAVYSFILGKKKRTFESVKDVSKCQRQLLAATKIICAYLNNRDQNYDPDYIERARPITQLTTEGLFESGNYPMAVDILASIDDEYLFFDQIIQTNLHNYFDELIRNAASYHDEANLKRICTMIYCIPALKNKIAFHRNTIAGLVSAYINNNSELFQASAPVSKVDYFLRLLERGEQDIYENDRRFFVELMLTHNAATRPYFRNILFPRVIRKHIIIYNAVYWDFILSFLDEQDESSVRTALAMFMNASIYQYTTNLPYIHKLFMCLLELRTQPFYNAFITSQAEHILTIISNTLLMLKQAGAASDHQLNLVLPFTAELLKQDILKKEIKDNFGKSRQTGACNSAFILQYYFSGDAVFDLSINYWQEFQKGNHRKAIVEYIYLAFVRHGLLSKEETDRIKTVTGEEFMRELHNEQERMKVYQFPFVEEEFTSRCS